MDELMSVIFKVGLSSSNSDERKFKRQRDMRGKRNVWRIMHERKRNMVAIVGSAGSEQIWYNGKHVSLQDESLQEMRKSRKNITFTGKGTGDVNVQ